MVVLALLVGLLAVPASAASVDISANFSWRGKQSSSGVFGQRSLSLSVPVSSAQSDFYYHGNGEFSFYPYSFYPSSSSAQYTNTVTLYVSYFFAAYYATSTLLSNPALSSSDFESKYMTDSGAYESSTVDVKAFKPDIISSYAATTGYTLSARVVGSEGFAVGLPSINYLPGDDKVFTIKVISGGSDADIGLMVTSARYVTTDTSAEAGALEDMADQIAQQNEIMQAFYGDIISILQAMDTKLGSLEAAADLTNKYLGSVIGELGRINGRTQRILDLLSTYLHYLEDIAKTAEDIKAELASFHTDFLTYIQLLISTISSESDDIQSKMEEIYSLLIAYLNNAFGSAVTPDVTEGIEGADNQLGAIEGIESQYTGSLSDKWNSIGISDFTLAPGLLSGVAWVSSWWTNFFEATGDFKVVLIMGLFFGVCGLLIGMISRVSRRAGGGEDDA